jgi:TonB family protein
MNGRFSPSDESGTLPQQALSKRLSVALAASLAIHAALILLPYFGKRVYGEREGFVPRMPAPAFSATLIATNSAAATARILPPAADDTGHRDDEAADRPADTAAAGALSSGMDILPMPVQTYYTTDELSKKPQPLVLAELDTPETQTVVASGKLILKLWIDDQGRVVDALVERSDLPELFSNTAVAAFKRSRFTPGERGGLQVGTVLRIEIRYDDNREP